MVSRLFLFRGFAEFYTETCLLTGSMDREKRYYPTKLLFILQIELTLMIWTLR